MTRDKKYIIYIALLIALLAYVYLSRSSQYDWTVTFKHNDKNPYGTYALSQLLPEYFKNQPIKHSYKTLYELKDSLSGKTNLIIICSNFFADKEDVNVLLSHIRSGGTAFISSSFFGGTLADTLGIKTGDSFYQGERKFDMSDSATLFLVSTSLDTAMKFQYRRRNVPNYFNQADSVRAMVIARNDFGQPITIRIKYGEGNLILNSTPMMFTNIYLLSNQNDRFVSEQLSYLPNTALMRSEYYHLGRMEVGTPLRFILTTEPLRWAYYITIISILLFMIFEAKRKQRVIPIIRPLTNTTLEFVSTVGNLYYQRGDHRNIAEKKVQYFFEQIHSHYRMSTQQRDLQFAEALSKKSGVSLDICSNLTMTINQILSSQSISKEQLVTLNQMLDRFQQITKL